MSLNNRIVLVLIGIFSFLGILMFVGCSVDASVLARKNISEIVDTYFCGTGDFNVSISSGKREDPYKYDGKRGNLQEFSVIEMSVSSQFSEIEVEIIVNEEVYKQILALNIITGRYIAELEKIVRADDKVFVKYKDSQVELVCRSNDFIVGSEKALELGINEFNEEIKKLVSQNEFLGECYLRVLDRAEDNFENIFWYFYIFAENKTTYSCVISVMTGEIVVRN